MSMQDNLLSLIDGFELLGSFDLYIDKEGMLYSYGRSMALGQKAYDVILGRHEVLPKAKRVYLPELNEKKSKNKVVFQGYMESLGFERQEVFSINPEISMFKIPDTKEKVIFEGKFVNGAQTVDGDESRLSFVSSSESVLYDMVIVDSRIKPIVYGPDKYTNRNKMRSWFDES